MKNNDNDIIDSSLMLSTVPKKNNAILYSSDSILTPSSSKDGNITKRLIDDNNYLKSTASDIFDSDYLNVKDNEAETGIINPIFAEQDSQNVSQIQNSQNNSAVKEDRMVQAHDSDCNLKQNCHKFIFYQTWNGKHFSKASYNDNDQFSNIGKINHGFDKEFFRCIDTTQITTSNTGKVKRSNSF